MQNTVTAEKPVKKAPPAPRNGVDTPTLFATIDVVAGQPDLARFRFRARNRWNSGTHCTSVMSDFFGAGAEHARTAAFGAEADDPAELCGQDRGAGSPWHGRCIGPRARHSAPHRI